MIRSSAIHAAGCYTTTAIRKGSRVAEYTGHLMSKEEADQRYEESPITYLFGLGDGSMVIDGRITRGAVARVVREGKVVGEGKVDSLRRFKDDVREVLAGFECGIILTGIADVQTGGDISAALTDLFIKVASSTASLTH